MLIGWKSPFDIDRAIFLLLSKYVTIYSASRCGLNQAFDSKAHQNCEICEVHLQNCKVYIQNPLIVVK